MGRGKQSHLHRANKKATRNFDAHKLDNIQNSTILPVIREDVTFDTKFQSIKNIRIPDFKIKKSQYYEDGCVVAEVLAEHDNVRTHGELGFEDEKTLRRNTDYWLAKRPFFVINENLAEHCGLNEVGLFYYLYYHTLSQFHAFWKADEAAMY